MNACEHDTIDNHHQARFHARRDGFISHEFTAWLPDAILVPKIREFIDSRPMRVISLSRDEVRVRIGSKRRFWSKATSLEADVDLSFHHEPREDELTRVEVNIRSNRRIADHVFRAYCGQLLRDIHKCLVARDIRCAFEGEALHA